MSGDDEKTKTRTLVPNSPSPDFSVNHIRTTKFTLITFVPLNLFEQFQRPSNIYFLVISILQAFPLSPYKPTAWFPLLVVLVVNAIKEALEDYGRFKQDERANNMETTLLTNSGLTTIPWKDVKACSYVLIKDGQGLPADIIIVASSDREGGNAYIETAELDGETNLKNRSALEDTHDSVSKVLGSATTIKDSGAVLNAVADVTRATIDLPNEDLEHLRGMLYLKASPPKEVVLSNKYVVLRGCKLKNTDWVVGYVIYTGMDTKLMKNSVTKAVAKHSSCERKTDKYTVGMFLLLVVLCVIGGVLYGAVYLGYYFDPAPWYLRGALDNAAGGTFLGMLTFIVLLSQLIPISLNVTMEMVKVAHALLINSDAEMKYNNLTMSCTEGKEEDFKYAAARTTNLSEDLGRIRYVFTDKTGTLTRNIMEFMKCSIKGDIYGAGLTEIARSLAKKRGEKLVEVLPPKDIQFDRGNCFYDPRIHGGAWKSLDNKADVEHFFRAVALCHTVIVKEEDGKKEYQAASPDEFALVVGAKGQGFHFVGRRLKDIIINVCGVEEVHTVLNVCEFDSDRKRMSVVAQDTRTGKIWVYCKGADTAIFDVIAGSETWHDQLKHNLAEFSLDGLRTLCITHKELDTKVYEEWNNRVVEATKGKAEDAERKIIALAKELESGLVLLGATAVEDKLQEGVPGCIHTLLKAKIQVWVLTGDKVETAINIAKACSLLDSRKPPIRIQSDVSKKDHFKDDAEREMDAKHSKAIMDKIRQSLEVAKQKQRDENGLAIDGASLGFALAEEERVGEAVYGDFLNLALACYAVVCCRVTPKQKALVTELVRYKVKMLTLSIGDGANDVPMIKSAHIGVGIAGGMEGQQAVLASDYSIAQFKFLQRLLLVHGRLDFIRISKLIPFAFYKNVSFAMTNYWYQIFAAWTGRKFMEDNYTNFWNVLFTAFPIMALAIFDKDIHDQDLAFYFPTMYEYGQESREFNSKYFALWMLDALIMSAVMLFFPLYIQDSASQNGRMDGVWGSTFASFTAVCTGVNIRVLIESKSWTWLHAATSIGSIIVFWLFTLVYHAQTSVAINYVQGDGDYSKLFYEIEAPDPLFWLVVSLCFITMLVPCFAYNAYQSIFVPSKSIQVAKLEQEWHKEFEQLCEKVPVVPTPEEYREYLMFKIVREKVSEVESGPECSDGPKFENPNSYPTTFVEYWYTRGRNDVLDKAGVKFLTAPVTETQFSKQRVDEAMKEGTVTSGFAFAAEDQLGLTRRMSSIRFVPSMKSLPVDNAENLPAKSSSEPTTFN